MQGQFILASRSPRRRVLLSEAGYNFEIIVPQVEETACCHFSLAELTLANATRKALAVIRSHPGRLVLAADTLVGFENKILGKPRDRAHAYAILRRLSGNTHQVCTAVFIGFHPGKFSTFTVWSDVLFLSLSDRAIRNYLEKVDPMDKAGAYAAQERSGGIIKNIAGSRTNVIGLPMAQAASVLATFGVKPRA